ncbi:MAG: cation:proton antiporter, partial [Leptospiraceae bacterium]|nr:cation:proton antiporter [Leptospiraceae bacterium]
SKASFSNFKILDVNISWQSLGVYAKSRLKNHIVQLVLQLIIILGFSRFLTILVRKIGQPSVIGEMFAGILLGPSALGFLAPEVFQIIFPKESLENLHNLSLFGLITFMFVLGMEFDIGIFESKIRAAVLISHLNIIFPFLLGTILAYFLYKDYASPTSNFLSFCLFMGVSLSITAFPVLARIVQETKLMKISLGSMAVMFAAIDDFTAWIILAAIISIVNSQGILTAIFSFLAVILYILFMLKFLQPFLTRLSRVYVTQEIIGRGVLSFLTLVLLTSALVTEILGIHAIFGAFLAGAIMPNVGELRKVLAEKTEDFTSIFLLPLFFAYTGLRTQVHLL